MSAQTLVPWSSPADGAPGWKILVPTRHIAGAVAAGTGGEPGPAEGSLWPVIVRRAGLAVTLLDADDEAFTCLLPMYGLRLTCCRRAWGELETLACPRGLPADGVLTVRQFTYADLAGQLAQALVPVFTAAGCGQGAAA